MHICYVESGYPHPHGGGGAGTYIQLVGRELVKRGHQVSVLAGTCPDCPVETLDQGVKVYRPSFKLPIHWYLSKIPLVKTMALSVRTLEWDGKAYRFLEDLNQRQPIDLVEFTEGVDFFHAFKPSFPTISHTHGSRYTTLKMVGRKVTRSDWYERKIGLFGIQRANWVFSPSQAMLSIVEREAGKPFRHSTVIPYPLDPILLAGSDTQITKPPGKKIVMFAARNDPVKGADVLMQSIPQVSSQVPEVEFWCFGYQPGCKIKLPQYVRLFPFLPKNELLPHYQAVDLVVVPSRWDNSPNSVYEAMAAGKAVVASRIGGIPELVVDGITGFLVTPGKPDELAHSIILLLKNDKQRLLMGHMAKDHILTIANLAQNVDLRMIIYQNIQSRNNL